MPPPNAAGRRPGPTAAGQGLPPPGLSAALREPLAEMLALLPLIARQLQPDAAPGPLLQLDLCCYRLLRSADALSLLGRGEKAGFGAGGVGLGALGAGPSAAGRAPGCTDLSALGQGLFAAAAAVLLPGQPPLSFAGAGGPLPVGCPPRPLATLLAALLANALQFTRDGNAIRLQLAQKGGRALVRLQDRGSGIHPQVLAHVFEPFYSADPAGQGGPPPGMGLGLSLARQLAARLGGAVTLESRLGQGSCVALSLPLRPAGGSWASPTAADLLLDRYSPLYLQLCDFCRLPDPV